MTSCSVCRLDFPLAKLGARPIKVLNVDPRGVKSVNRYVRSLVKTPEAKVYFRRGTAKGRRVLQLQAAGYVNPPRQIISDNYVTELSQIPLACNKCSDSELDRAIQTATEWSAERDEARRIRTRLRLQREERRRAKVEAKADLGPTPNRGTRSSIPARIRFQVLRRDGFRCVYCGRAAIGGLELHVDHVVPKSKGGLDTEDNLVTACADCNLGKSATLVTAGDDHEVGDT